LQPWASYLPVCLCHQAEYFCTDQVGDLFGWESNQGPGGKWHPSTGVMWYNVKWDRLTIGEGGTHVYGEGKGYDHDLCAILACSMVPTKRSAA